MSLIKALLESEDALINNIASSSVINKLNNIQEEMDIFPKDIQYTAESVNVFVMPQNGKDLYVIECDNLLKLMKSQNLDPSEALRDIQHVISSNDEVVNFNDVALLVKDENIEVLQELCDANKPSHGARVNNIVEYTDMLKEVKSLGINILVNRH